jgi:hypothetical protein
MNRTLRLLTVPSVALALALAATAQPESQPASTNPPAAQQTPQPATPAPKPARPRTDPAERPLIDVDFEGGTFGHFVKLVQAASNPAPNIVVMPELERARIGKITLRRITTLSALQAAITASEDSEQSRKWTVTFDDAGGQSALYRVSVDYSRFSPQASSGKPSGPSLQVFPFREWTGSPETMLSAIEAAMRMLDDRDPPKISFHPESGLLFVSGTPAHVEMVTKVLDAMEQRANSSKNSMEIGIARQIIESIGTREPAAARQMLTELQKRAAQLTDLQIETAKVKAVSEARVEAMLREMEDLKHRAEVRFVESESVILKLRDENARLESLIRSMESEAKQRHDKAAADSSKPR